MTPFPVDLYLILDSNFLSHQEFTDAAREAIRGGIRMVQFRDKKGGTKERYEVALRLREVTREENALLIINDDVDLAMAVEADGVHLGQEDLPVSRVRSLWGPHPILGASVHTLDQASSAQEAGANYLGVGPIFPSNTKQARPCLGPEILSRFRSKISIPIFAIGGISEQNAREVIRAGANGIACVSALLLPRNSPDGIRRCTERLLKITLQSQN